MEEARETAEALTGETWIAMRAAVQPVDPKPNLVLAADGLADIVVVTLGAAVALGIELGPITAEVIAANRRKFAAGASMREDGKFVKPPDFVPPDIAGALRRQGWAG
jgi:predicted HAD superfamily Cof-like phosphohydrolase